MKRLILVALLVSAPAAAQQSGPPVGIEELAVAKQMLFQSQELVISLGAQLSRLQAENQKLKEQLAKANEPKKP